MIACLPMYDWPEVRPATDAFWQAITDSLGKNNVAAPATLTRADDLMAQWRDPQLVLGQTCGLPYRAHLSGSVQLVGTPDYGLPECPTGHYYSTIVAHQDTGGPLADFWDRTLAVNAFDSQSGWAAPANMAATAGCAITRTILTGAHLNSAQAVAERRADFAALDVVTWRMIQRFRPKIASCLRVVAHTPPTPGLPLITAPAQDAQTVRHAVRAALQELPISHLHDLGITGIAKIPTDAYLAIPTPPPLSA